MTFPFDLFKYINQESYPVTEEHRQWARDILASLPAAVAQEFYEEEEDDA